ncbi:PRC-barrel domain-containing protein [Thiofilum flexile]|uniref:PRC-barrel domain-containing protein n=1 Tax=Thiofilum flexile TaxID=125627 RepID=UPI000370CBF5|nr:PRC-barrel domain-containing protein [Thiofilum flexile]
MSYRFVLALSAVLFAATSLVQVSTAADETPAATAEATPATAAVDVAPAEAASAEAAPAATTPPVAGASLTGVSVTEFVNVVNGWSVKKSLLDKKVVNEKDDKVGEVEDLIIAPDTALSYAVLEVGGFLGMGEHRVAIPVKFFQMQGDKIVLDGATKQLLEKMPAFNYTK